MKILCLTDFSESSLNAIYWTMDLCNSYSKANIEILHCIDIKGRADMFLKIDDLLIGTAMENLEKMKAELETRKKNINIEISINAVKASPKSYVGRYAESNEFDLIVTGAKGLSNLRRYTVGSVTYDIMLHANFTTLDKNGTINKTINDYALNENADAIAFIHNKRSLLNRFIQRSVTREELTELKLPLFILPN